VVNGVVKLFFRVSCWGEAWTVQREGVNLRYFSGVGVVKNVPEDKAAVFEVCCGFDFDQLR
jgi:hypothetical protein